MNINTTLTLDDSQYYKVETPKKQIYLHHTVGGSAKSTFNWWQQSPEKVGTAYIIERDGTIYQVFDPKFWSYHLGLKHQNNTMYNKQSIGIELASEGCLRSGKELNDLLVKNNSPKRFDELWLYAFDITPDKSLDPKFWFSHAKKLYNIISDLQSFVHIPVGWRDFYFFDGYDESQIQATNELVKYLCETFSIPKQVIPNTDRFEFDPLLLNFTGVLTHCNVRKDKTDLNPSWDFNRTLQYIS